MAVKGTMAMETWFKLLHMNKLPFIRRTSFVVSDVCGCSVGIVRDNNEDNFFFHGQYLNQDNQGLEEVLAYNQLLDKPVIYAIFDGMGGEAYGEAASYIAARTLEYFTKRAKKQPVDLLEVCREANLAVCSFAEQKGAEIIGSTVAMLQLLGQTAEIVNIGDSKIFLFRDGILTQVSEDHTDRNLLETQGIFRKPRLTQHLGIPPMEMQLVPYKVHLEIREGDHFLLCSDGLTDMVSEEEIQSVLDKAESMRCAVENLIELAIENGGRDNTTVICCEITNGV